MGHALGVYGHTQVISDIMYYANNTLTSFEVTDNEIRNLMTLYDVFCF